MIVGNDYIIIQVGLQIKILYPIYTLVNIHKSRVLYFQINILQKTAFLIVY